jgi:hypothetical protein
MLKMREKRQNNAENTKLRTKMCETVGNPAKNTLKLLIEENARNRGKCEKPWKTRETMGNARNHGKCEKPREMREAAGNVRNHGKCEKPQEMCGTTGNARNHGKRKSGGSHWDIKVGFGIISKLRVPASQLGFGIMYLAKRMPFCGVAVGSRFICPLFAQFVRVFIHFYAFLRNLYTLRILVKFKELFDWFAKCSSVLLKKFSGLPTTYDTLPRLCPNMFRTLKHFRTFYHNRPLYLDSAPVYSA